MNDYPTIMLTSSVICYCVRGWQSLNYTRKNSTTIKYSIQNS